MAREKRRISTFSLSFLDIMACGFGAVTLLFLILKHEPTSAIEGSSAEQAEARLLAEDIRVGKRDRVELKNTLAVLDEQIRQAQGQSRRVLDDLNERRRELGIQDDPEKRVALLREQVTKLEAETARLRKEGRADDTRAFLGDGDRQYLTGLKLGGQRALILVDGSASMLAETIVNVVRRRNMDDTVKRNAEKWRRAIRTVEWLAAQLPRQGSYQIYTFNTETRAVLPGTEGRWLDVSDSAGLDRAVRGLQAFVPAGGTNLYRAFTAADQFSLKPDNVFLLTDGLPTLGKSAPRGSTVSGKKRGDLFREASKVLPKGVPVNVILFPMEGDPGAAAAYWQLGLASRGSFLSPSRDWP